MFMVEAILLLKVEYLSVSYIQEDILLSHHWPFLFHTVCVGSLLSLTRIWLNKLVYHVGAIFHICVNPETGKFNSDFISREQWTPCANLCQLVMDCEIFLYSRPAIHAAGVEIGQDVYDVMPNNVAFELFQRDEVEYLRTSRSALIECGGILQFDGVDIKTLFDSRIVELNAKIEDVPLDRVSIALEMPRAKAKTKAIAKAKAKSRKYIKDNKSMFKI